MVVIFTEKVSSFVKHFQFGIVQSWVSFSESDLEKYCIFLSSLGFDTFENEPSKILFLYICSSQNFGIQISHRRLLMCKPRYAFFTSLALADGSSPRTCWKSCPRFPTSYGKYKRKNMEECRSASERFLVPSKIRRDSNKSFKKDSEDLRS